MANSNSPLQSVFSPSSPNTRPALVFSLRMLNLPLPLIPHLYRMLLEELETKEEGRFTHFLVWGRGYRLEGTEEGMGLDMNVVEKSSKKKKALGNETVALSAGSFPYHPEEEFMDKVSACLTSARLSLTNGTGCKSSPHLQFQDGRPPGCRILWCRAIWQVGASGKGQAR